MSVSDEDLAKLVEYVDGRIDDQEEIFRFEERLVAEPDLAEVFESFSRVDLLAHFARSRTRSIVPRTVSHRSWLVPAAAAAVILAAAYLAWPERPGPRLGLIQGGSDLVESSALLKPSGEELVALAPHLGAELEGALAAGAGELERPPRSGTTRGAGDDPRWSEWLRARDALARLAASIGLDDPLVAPPAGHPSASEWERARADYEAARAAWEDAVERYWALAGPVQDARAELALEAEPRPLEAERFHLVVEPDEERSALVFVLDSAGATYDAQGERGPRTAFPAIDRAWVERTARLAAGAPAILPAAPLVRSIEQEVPIVTAEAGFVVPWKAGEIEVLVATRRDPLDEALRASLLDLLAGQAGDGTRRALEAWLSEHGFDLATRRVREKQTQ